MYASVRCACTLLGARSNHISSFISCRVSAVENGKVVYIHILCFAGTLYSYRAEVEFYTCRIWERNSDMQYMFDWKLRSMFTSACLVKNLGWGELLCVVRQRGCHVRIIFPQHCSEPMCSLALCVL